MLKISEHFQYYNDEHISELKKVFNWKSYFEIDDSIDTIFFDKANKYACVSLKLGKENEEYQCSITSSYYIGLDRFSKFKLPVYIQPKVNHKFYQLNYIEMLFEALKEPENFDHLEGLVTVKFEEEWIDIKNELLPELTPFLIAQFLATVKGLVKKGLKKSYYSKIENLNNRVKGKVLVGRQIKENSLKNKLTHTVCQYQEFGFDTEVNQFLKYVLNICKKYFGDFATKDTIRQNLEEVWRFCQAGFQQVGGQSFLKLNYRESNPFYKEYNLAIQLGNQILALQDYNISRNANQTICRHPPFWIDMSKLFELYVFRKLREKFKGKEEVVYQYKTHQQELDFIINSGSIKAVVDAKYKPRYANGNPSIEDARQLSGYTRLNKVYNELGIADDSLIPAYFIYPSNLPVIFQNETSENIEVFEKVNPISGQLLDGGFRKSKMYKQMYLQEIGLPIIMKLVVLFLLIIGISTTSYAQKKAAPHWFSQKLKSADSVLMISHYKTKGNMMVDTNGQIIPFQELILNNKPNYAVVLERKLITGKAIDSLVSILTRPAPRRIYALAGCFSPHHAIFIFKDNQTSYLNLCFDCKRGEASKDLFKLPIFDPKRWEDLRAFYIKQGFKYQLK